MKKKGQVQSGETIMVVIIVMILIVLGIVYGANRKQESVVRERENVADINIMNTAILVLGLNELKCSEFSASISNCIDLYRLLALSDVIKDKADPDVGESAYFYYYELFGNSNISVRIINISEHSNGEEQKDLVINLYAYEDSANVNRSMATTFVPVLVQNPISKNNEFALLEVAVYR